MKRFSQIIGAVLSVALLSGCAGETGRAANTSTETSAKSDKGPAIWKVTDADTTLYLFGTVHVLPEGLNWRTPTFDAVYDEATTMYFEANVDQDNPELGILVNKLGMMPLDRSLFDLLDPQEKQELLVVADQVGLTSASLSRFKPWFAGMVLSLQHIVAQGQDPNSGVESVLHPEALLDGKEMRYFETPEEQLRFMADLSEDVQVEFLMDGVRQIKDLPDMIKRMDDAWLEGDVDTLEDILMEDQSATAPEVYEVMLAGRNRAWAEKLNDVAATEPGVFMVAVGAAHLTGDDALNVLLQESGLLVERIQ